MSSKSRGLGKGLGALLPDKPLYENNDSTTEFIRQINITKIIPNHNQPRRDFDNEKLQELSESIKEHGILQPIIVVQEGINYKIVAGERRYRAAKMADLKTIPCIIRKLSNTKVLELALIENIQREDLMPLEEATALHTLTEQLSVSKTDLAKKLGKSRSYVSNMIRLLDLPIEVQELVTENRISYGHARALLSLNTREEMIVFANEIVKNNLSVRDIEKIVRKQNNSVQVKEKEIKKTSPEDNLRFLIIKEYENDLKSLLKTQVQIKDAQNKGRIIIDYYSDEDLDRLIRKFRK
ncbi:ParB/RepB/Spo0J family partition protein [Clostridium sp. 'deep sea']|uniref:ParB/RepB/Spo0J family partition protein n=1 Tax=Clostridium sp. 'deep sea' TaxID=2779445 RepID=UPI0018969D48|nr:ParB/RepB/Spo0J family partition protein [Clostridium sp. 'deep sea']QOR34095.1 ParB/RepB/Spo0J family partition protein [Clostridium sp. 'deep sea']